MLAWHFLTEDKHLGFGDGRLVEVGQTLECEGEPALYRNGMHGSVRLIDALHYARGPVVCRVEIEGDIIEGDNKLCGRRRTVLWMLDATRIIHEFACQCADDALALIAEPDPRSVAGIAAKRRWLAGEITDDELAAASEAAWSAAWSASSAAARAAASAAASAAARAAALDAARAATSDAARAAAWAAASADASAAARAAARSAAWSASSAAAWAAAARYASYAAWAAALDAARAAARKKQDARLTEMVMEAHEKEDE